MLLAPIPADDDVRLERLRSTGLLDTQEEERFDRVTRLARHFFKVPVCLVSLVDKNRQWFKSRQGLAHCSETPRDISFCGHAINSSDILMIPDATKDVRFSDNPLVVGAPWVRFYAGYPLRSFDGHILGTLCLIDHVPRTLSRAELGFLADFGKLIEAEITSIHLATMDALTGLYNRLGFDNLAEQMLLLSRRSALQCTLIYLDLDKFKVINDNWGHAEGDVALRAFADCLQQSVRDCDIVARLGGDEFAVLLTHNGSDCVATQIEQRLAGVITRFNSTSGKPWQLAFSLGAASLNQDNINDLPELMSAADTAMYQVKATHSGHNRGLRTQ
ncbi:diguanylate cyclase domain-containing protein [Shewanella sp. GXUN23E]|uniref:GGDEF domain-containing protein n=1 Tax=Shewanella sp. GXUN23E TaxID=3422498 RepID=UPI003D7E34BA